MGSTEKLLNQIMDLKFTAKSLQRQARKCDKEEKAEKLKVKKAIEKGNMDGARIYAENAIRKRTEQMNYLRLASRLDAVVARLDTQAKMTTINKSMASIVKSLESSLATGNLQKMSETMDQFEKQFVNMEVQAEFMESSMAGSTSLSTPEGEVTSLMQQVADDYGLEVSVGLPQAATHAVPTKASEKVEEDDLSRRKNLLFTSLLVSIVSATSLALSFSSSSPSSAMPGDDSTDPSGSQQRHDVLSQEQDSPKENDPDANLSGSDSDSDSDSDDSSSDEEEGGGTAGDDVLTYTRPSGDDLEEDDNTPEANIRRFSEILNSRRMRRKLEEEDKNYVFYEDLFDFPEDPEKWREEDLKELWADAPLESTKPGWDPAWADEEDWDIVKEEIKAGRQPAIAPFYLPYRRPYPAIPDNHYDISNPKAVVEELDRIEEFLKWVSYIFPDGSSYEGTVWDDLAHGKGVYVAEMGLVRYEGEWLQNNMEGHGVVEVDIPDIEPLPGSKLEEKMRAEGKIIKRDYMSPEDREWLEMDIEDSIRLTGDNYQVPFYENDEWIRQFGEKPEKGRYRYAGQWKHGRMHGCGVYEVNECLIYGRFYFGELLEDEYGCDEDVSALHSGIAEVAAAKARMFVNKPDGMVREERGPYGDPQHPYFYEEEDVWMAPGFINQFYEVPDYWKTYVGEVDQEREMWLNSFYKAPLRLPMPAELEYWWSQDHTPEFVLINKEPEPDPQDPSKLIYTEDPLILHTPTGRIINYVDDEEHGIRLFWQPDLKEGEDVDPEKVEFLPLGFDEFYGKEEVVKKESLWKRIIMAMENACKPTFDRLEKWTEEKKKTSEMKIKLIEKELDLVEAELCLEEAIEDMDEELKMTEKDEENIEVGFPEGVEMDSSVSAEKDENTLAADEEEEAEGEEEEDEDEDEDAEPTSFGSVPVEQDSSKNEQKGSKPGGSPFSTSSLGFASCGLVSVVSSKLQHSFLSWKESRSLVKATPTLHIPPCGSLNQVPHNLSYSPNLSKEGRLRARRQEHRKHQARRPSKGSASQLHSLSRILSPGQASRKSEMNPKEPRSWRHAWLHKAPKDDLSSVLSLHNSLYHSESYTDSGMK